MRPGKGQTTHELPRQGQTTRASDNPRAVRQETLSALQESDNPVADTPHARIRQPTSCQATNQQIERVRTSTGTGRSGRRRIDDSVGSCGAGSGASPGPGDRHGTAPSVIEAQPVTDEVRASAVATATAEISSGPQRTPVRWGGQGSR
jgi:hypothetical protein